jgi:heavy metal sensor kinase
MRLRIRLPRLNWPLRARLTLWYISLLACLLALFDMALYSTLSLNLRREIDQNITARASEVSSAITEVLVARSDPRTYLLQGRIVLPTIDVFASPGIYVQVLSANGQIVAKSGNLGEQRLPFLLEDFAAMTQGAADALKTVSAGGADVRLVSAPIMLEDNLIGVVQVGRSLSEMQRTLRALLYLLLGGTVLGLLVAMGVGGFLAKRALAPVDAATRAAQSIVDAQGLSQRLDYHDPPDEIGRLILTFNRMLERIELLFRLQQRFTADVSHELRTPLTTIRGYLDLVARAELDGDLAERAQVLRIAQEEVERMSRLVADLLLLAQADAGVKLDKISVELDTLLLDVYRQEKPLAGGVRFHLGAEDQAVVMGDPDRLKQLLLNLVDNALKYTLPGGQVTLGLSREEGWAAVTVMDTGPGIPAEDLPRLFDRFYRVDKSRARPQGGTGLGLSIARWIAEAHGGSIAVQSEVGKGSVFTVRLPLAPGQ